MALMSSAEIHDAAVALYDGGWRWNDVPEMIAEYGLSLKVADRISQILYEMEKEEEEDE